jgi:L-2-hydroxyglutarate oxidase LhgO
VIEKADILICGGGIIGLTIARELLRKGFENIVIIDKENHLGEHASGRNSGVLHAGIYYAPDSLKARFCLKGNFMMREYCKERDISLLESGKVIVAKNEEEIPVLEELFQRSLKNGARAELIDESRLKTIEPFAKTLGLALHSPDTAVVDPGKILVTIEADLVSTRKVKILKGVEFSGLKEKNEIITKNGNITYDLFINAAGAYSDRIAHFFGAGLNYKLIPFKGTYKKLKENKSYLVRGNIYPVPDMGNPFLGVHFTKALDGTVYVGPTAIPAFGRENYGILEGLSFEFMEILCRDILLFISNPEFRSVTYSEPRKYLSGYFFNIVKDMLENLDIRDIEPSRKVGIRPQLVDWKNKELVMDFEVLRAENSIHILNAVSPAFTSAMAFAEFVVEKYLY